ncbi:MAG: glycosyltransferase family 4 protein [Pseudomonadota bacterium]
MSNLPSVAGQTILQVIPELSAGGAERTVIEMAEAITEAGGRALVASEGGRMVDDLVAAGGTHLHFDLSSKNPVAIFRNALRLTDLIKDEGVSLIHARSRAPAWSAWRAAQATDIPFVTTYHGAYSGTSGPKRTYNSVMAKGDFVIANSRWIGDHIKDVHEVPDDRIVIIPRGVDFEAFDPGRVTADRLANIRKQWTLVDGDRRTVILLPARLTEWKGQLLALEALIQLSPEEVDSLVLILAGDAQGRNDYAQRIQTFIADYNLANATRIVGHCEDMPAAFAAADIVLNPSRRPEAFGRTAAEAAAMERPVIAADHGGARETVIDGQTGVRFTPGDAPSLAAALRSLISVGQATRLGMGQAGRDHVKAHYSKRGLQAATLSVYTSLIAQGIARRA